MTVRLSLVVILGFLIARPTIAVETNSENDNKRSSGNSRNQRVSRWFASQDSEVCRESDDESDVLDDVYADAGEEDDERDFGLHECGANNDEAAGSAAGPANTDSHGSDANDRSAQARAAQQPTDGRARRGKRRSTLQRWKTSPAAERLRWCMSAFI